MKDIGRDKKSDALNEGTEYILSGRDFNTVARNGRDEPTNKKLDKGDQDRFKKQEQPIVKQVVGVFLCKDLSGLYAGKDAAQKPIGKDQRKYVDRVDNREPDPRYQLYLVVLVCPHPNIIVQMNGHAPRIWGMLFLRADRVLKGPVLCVQPKALAPHKAQDHAEGIEQNDKIACKFHELRRMPRGSLVCEFADRSHDDHLRPHGITGIKICQ